MRFLFLLILLAGIVLSAGMPWIANNFSGREIGTYLVFDRETGFKPVDVTLAAADAPVRILVDLTSIGAPTIPNNATVLTLTVAGNGRTVLADTMSFAGAAPRDNAPQLPDKVLRAFAGPLTDIEDGSYRFTFGEGDADEIDIRQVEMILRAESALLDPRLQPIGFALMAFGFIGFVLAARRRRRAAQANPNSQPPAPRWGRDADKR